MSPTKRNAPPAPALNEKAQTVLQAARTVFLTHGFSAATTDMIQRAAGVSKSTVYAHYSSKEALFIAVIETQCAQFMAEGRALEIDAQGLHNTLTALARAYLELILSPSGLALFRVIVAEAPRFPQLARTFYLTGPHATNNMVAGHIARAARQGELDLDEIGVEAAADQFVNLVRSEGQLQCLTHPESRPSAAQLDLWASVAVKTFLRAYGNPAYKK